MSMPLLKLADAFLCDYTPWYLGLPENSTARLHLLQTLMRPTAEHQTSNAKAVAKIHRLLMCGQWREAADEMARADESSKIRHREFLDWFLNSAQTIQRLHDRSQGEDTKGKQPMTETYSLPTGAAGASDPLRYYLDSVLSTDSDLNDYEAARLGKAHWQLHQLGHS